MKKFAISIIALAALSTVAFAEGQRDEDLIQAGILKSGNGTQSSGASAGSYAFATVGNSGTRSAFFLATQNAEASERSGNNSQ